MASVGDGEGDSKEIKDLESEPPAKRKKREKYNLRQKTLVTRIETEERLAAPKQPKPKSRPPPLSKYRRKTANSRERGRMKEINTAFQELQTVLPPHCVQETDGANLTKITTLRLAVNYIAALRQVLGESGSAAEGCPQAAGETCELPTHTVVTDSRNHVATVSTTDVVTNNVADGVTDIALHDGVTDIALHDGVTDIALHDGGRPVVDDDTVASNRGCEADGQQGSQDTPAPDQANIPGSGQGADNRNVCDSLDKNDASPSCMSRVYTEDACSVLCSNDATQPESDLEPRGDANFSIQHTVPHANGCTDGDSCSRLGPCISPCVAGDQFCESVTRPAPPYPFSPGGGGQCSAAGLVWSSPPYGQLPAYSDIHPLTDVLSVHDGALTNNPPIIFTNDDPIDMMTDAFLHN